jgi:hypothetical protein
VYLHLIAINRKPSQKNPKVDHCWNHFEQQRCCYLPKCPEESVNHVGLVKT